MAHIYVIMTGLMVLVERERSLRSPSTVLLRKVQGDDRVNGVPIPRHTPLLQFRQKGKEISVIIEGDIRFSPEGVGPPDVQQRLRFLPLGRELDDVHRVKSKLLEGSLDTTVAGRLILGGGSISPVQVDVAYDLEKVFFEIRNILVSAIHTQSGASKAKNNRPISNGLLYHRDIDGSSVELVHKGVPYNLEPTPERELGNLPRFPGSEHYVVWVTNFSEDVIIVADPPRPMADLDFDLLYDWLDGFGGVRFIPEVLLPHALAEKPLSPPGVCMGARSIVAD